MNLVSEIAPQTTPNSNSTLFLDDDKVKVWEDLATVLKHGDRARSQNDLERAHIFYARATELDPNHADAWVGRAETATEINDAIICWAYAVSLAPDRPDAQARLQDRIDQKLAHSDTPDAEPLIRLGRTIAEAGLGRFALPLLRRATELEATNQVAWLWRAGVAQDTLEIMSCLNQVLAINPENVQAKAGLEWASSHQPTLPPTRSLEDQARHLVQQGLEILDNGDRQEAHTRFTRATELNQHDEMAWLWRGSTTVDVDEALTCMEQALAINPANESAREARSWLRVKKLREGIRPKGGDRLMVPAGHPNAARTHRGSIAVPLFVLISLFLLLAVIGILLARLLT